MIYVYHCPIESCGWFTLSRKTSPTECEVCHDRSGAAYKEEHDACAIMSFSDTKAKHVWKHAAKHGVMVFQVSKRRYHLLTTQTANTAGFGGTEQRKWCYTSLRPLVEGPVDYQTAMLYVRDHTPELPSYLAR